MQDYILERTIAEGEYILKTKCTVRECAKIMDISKSTVHSDINERLVLLDRMLYDEVKKILVENFSERHIRGGISTREKFAKKKSTIVST